MSAWEDDNSETKKPIGHILDAAGCVATIADGELVGGAVVVIKVIEENGDVRLTTCWSDGLTWFERVGMLRIAEQMDMPTDSDRERT